MSRKRKSVWKQEKRHKDTFGRGKSDEWVLGVAIASEKLFPLRAERRRREGNNCPFRAERRRRKARREKCTHENCTLPTIHLGLVTKTNAKTISQT